jgi:dTDP-4-amino-4,6-dideoxygalactose transaminase
MAMTNCCGMAERMALLRNHGITRNPDLMTQEPEGPWYYQQIDLGYNYRMTDIQAALGLNQMTRLENYVKTRHFLAGQYNKALAKLPLILPWQHPDTYSAFHLYPIRIAYDRAGIDRNMVFDTLRTAGIGVNVHYIPVHLQPYYRAHGFGLGDFPEAESYYTETITLPLFPTMEMKEQEKIVSVLQAIFV